MGRKYTFFCGHLLIGSWDLFSLLQASGSMSPGVQVLRERASIHGSISHVRYFL